MRKALSVSVASLAVLGMLAGCLILARGGFTTSNKRGGWEVFVPAPQAYVLAAIMLALSILAVLWLLNEGRARARGYILAAALYAVCAVALTRVLLAGF